VEQVGQHPHAALLDLRGDRVLGVVDEVGVEVLRDDPLRLRLHPGRDEGGEVALGIALQARSSATSRIASTACMPLWGKFFDGADSVRKRLPNKACAGVSVTVACLVLPMGRPPFSCTWVGQGSE
jgi:hypothetical protein